MTEDKLKLLGTLVSKVLSDALGSGLTWDESVAAFGVVSKALADRAWKNGDGTQEDCCCHAHKRFNQGFEQDVVIIGSFVDPKLYNDLSASDVEAMLSNCHYKSTVVKH